MPSVPPTGYSLPYIAQPGFDPLISPDAGGWWRRSMAIVKAGWTNLAAIQAIGAVATVTVQVPLQLFLAGQRSGLLPTAPTDGAAPATPNFSALLAFLGLTLAIAFAAVVVGAVVTIATIHVGVTIAAGGQPRLGPALLAAARRAFPLLGWQLVAGLIMVAGLCACILPFFYLLAVFTLLPAVVAFERTNPISRCFRLFHGSLGPAVGRIAAILGIGLGAGILGSILSGAVGAAGGLAPTSATTSASVAATVVSTLVSAVIAGGAAVLTGPLTLAAYADLRAGSNR